MEVSQFNVSNLLQETEAQSHHLSMVMEIWQDLHRKIDD